MNKIQYNTALEQDSIYDLTKEMLVSFTNILIWNNSSLIIKTNYNLSQQELEIDVQIIKSSSEITISYTGGKNKTDLDAVSITAGLKKFTELFNEKFRNLDDVDVSSVEINDVQPLEQKSVESVKSDSAVNDLNKRISAIDFKMANEAGIAGFIFSLLIPLYKNFMIINLNTNIFSQIHPNNEHFIFVFIIIAFAIIALILSIKGSIKDSKKYQDNLATWGLVFNIFNIIDLSFAIFNP